YSGAVYRYLLSLLGDVHAADEVFQQFALEFVRGGFRHAHPDRGQFRNYLKVSLVRLASAYRKKERRGVQNKPLEDSSLEAFEGRPDDELLQRFVKSCRDEFISRAWTALRDLTEKTGQPFFHALQYRSQHPEASSQEMAEALTAALRPERPFTAAGIRKVLQRSREQFSDLLLREVARTLEAPTREELEEEVVSLGLQAYCRSALRRRYAEP
ncbi:MAG: sigma-70 family RNA polymerase sigma factor, partial [Planctomycetes bacterium]|nr:sigma-70 family RNA polymerase sigma factor [Planctomycetota bacterium]